MLFALQVIILLIGVRYTTLDNLYLEMVAMFNL